MIKDRMPSSRNSSFTGTAFSAALKKLSDRNLLEATQLRAAEERRIGIEVLYHFIEIDSRKIFLHLGYLSVLEYAIRELRYSESAAVRRVHAMHALQELPELDEKIRSGILSITNIARVRSFMKREEKMTGQKWTLDEKKSLYQLAEKNTRYGLERTLMDISPRCTVKESSKEVAPGLHQMKIFLPQQDVDALDQLRSLLKKELKNPASNSELIQKLITLSKATSTVTETAEIQKATTALTVAEHEIVSLVVQTEAKALPIAPVAKPGVTNNVGPQFAIPENLFNFLALQEFQNLNQFGGLELIQGGEASPGSLLTLNSQHTLEQMRDQVTDHLSEQMDSANGISPLEFAALAPVQSQPHPNQRRYIPVAIKKFLFSRSGMKCEHVDAETGKRCESTFNLEIDHLKPFAVNGAQDVENLKVVCPAHNQIRTRFLN